MVSSLDFTSNRNLSALDKYTLSSSVNLFETLVPSLFKIKSPELLFPNAFVFEQAKSLAKKTDNIIVIGGFEDPTGYALQALGYNVVITDPLLDGRDMSIVWQESVLSAEQYDFVICSSVLEYVEDDISFIKQMYDILKPNGVAMLTTSYRSDEIKEKQDASLSVRLYDREKLQKLIDILPPNTALHKPTWRDVEPDAFIQNRGFSFCSFAFRKKEDVFLLRNPLVKKHVLNEYKKSHRTASEALELRISQLNVEAIKQQKIIDQFHAIGPSAIKIARKIRMYADRFPTFAKVIKRFLKSFMSLKNKFLGLDPNRKI